MKKTSKPKPTSRLREDVQQLLANLQLRRIEEILDEELASAEQDEPSYLDWLARLLRAQYHHRQETALAWRVKQAHLPEAWTLESFPYKLQPGVQQRQIRAFAELDFIGKGDNIVFIGPTGVGKTGLTTGILLKAIQNGHRSLFIKAQDLCDEIYASLADRSSRVLLRRLARVPLLAIDELGYLNLRPEQANAFFKLMSERHDHRRPSIITSNLDYEEWGNFLGHKELTKALLSRLRQYCHTVRIDGPSLREPRQE